MDFKVSRTDLVGLLGKQDSVIELGLFCCNWLGLETHLCPLSLYKEMHGAPPCTLTIIQSIQCKRLTPTGRKGYYSITRARTSINRHLFAFTVEFLSLSMPSKHRPGYPHDGLLVIKHRQAPKVKVISNMPVLEAGHLSRPTSKYN